MTKNTRTPDANWRDRGPAVRRSLTVLRFALQRFNAHDMSTHAAALAFRIFFAVFPFLLFLVTLLGFLHAPQFFDWLREQAAVLVPAQAYEQVNAVIDEIQRPQGGLLSIGIAVALWAASGGTRGAMTALNAAEEMPERRQPIYLAVLSVFYTVALAVMMILAALLLTVGPRAAQWVAALAGLESGFVLLWTLLRWPLWVVLLTASVTLLYYAGPSRHHPIKNLLPGAAVCVLSWIVASLAFGFYLSHFANYSALYGGIGTVIALLIYLSISSSVLLFGAEVNAVLELERNERSVEPRKIASSRLATIDPKQNSSLAKGPT